MQNTPQKIHSQYVKGCDFKSALGAKGMFEQNKINERFYIGDQWYCAKCGNDRPLVRHNVIKRIADYKISTVLNNPLNVIYSADGVPSVANEGDSITDLSVKEINNMMSTFSNYYTVTGERVKINDLNENVMRSAYINGSSILYTYWDSTIPTGQFADNNHTTKIKGDICCEVLSIENVVFADPYIDNLQKQPYIIISSCKNLNEVLHEARIFGASITTLTNIEAASRDGKVTVYTKLYKTFSEKDGYRIKGIKVTENAVVRQEFDTRLTLYPLSIFSWNKKNSLIYGESEITYLIPNQIAINRMITANVWASMSGGMPIMLVNGDSVNGEITNEPGQIIKVFGSNEDVAGAVKYVTPPTVTKDFDESINTLIENTLSQSGANEVALGDSKAENASALNTMRNASLMPLQIIKNRFYSFIEDTARIWVDFWLGYYGKRNLKVVTKSGTEYISFNAADFKELVINAKVDITPAANLTERERADLLITLFEKGIINRNELLCRMPGGMIANVNELITNTPKGEKP